ncbi:MAG: HlyC/CorC family transporter [Planctomycetota bacterium]|nr:MAG: HlyC/CorC family transporter [Planctomycetota bacterium]
MDIDGSSWWIWAFISFGLTFFFSLLRESLYYASTYKLEKIYSHRKGPEAQKQLNFYLEHLEEMSWVVSTLQGFSFFALLFLLFLRYYLPFQGKSPLYLLLLFGFALLVFIFGTLVPKMIASAFSESILYYTLPQMFNITRLFKPIVIILEYLEKITLRILAAKEDEEADLAREEIIEALREGERYGLLAKESKKMIESLIRFTSLDASEVMVPRTEMKTLEVNTSPEEAARFAIETGHSRIPVFEENQDNIVGILYVKDLFRAWLEKKEFHLKDILRKPNFIPETKQVSSLLREFKAKKVHIAIVLDEYGGTSGLITIEDILEEIVGEIDDEYDREEPEPPIKKINESTLEVDGRVHIDDLNDEYGLQLSEEGDYETIGGLITSHLGRIPQKGEVISYNDELEFTILEADERKIDKVKISISQKT